MEHWLIKAMRDFGPLLLLCDVLSHAPPARSGQKRTSLGVFMLLPCFLSLMASRWIRRAEVGEVRRPEHRSFLGALFLGNRMRRGLG